MTSRRILAALSLAGVIYAGFTIFRGVNANKADSGHQSVEAEAAKSTFNRETETNSDNRRTPEGITNETSEASLGVFSKLPDEILLDILRIVAEEDKKTLFRLRRLSTAFSHHLVFRPEIWHTFSWTNKDKGPPQRAMMMAFREVAKQARQLGIRGISSASCWFSANKPLKGFSGVTNPKSENFIPMLQSLLAHQAPWLESLELVDLGPFVDGATKGAIAGLFAVKQQTFPALKFLNFIRSFAPELTAPAGNRSDPAIDKLLANLTDAAPHLESLRVQFVNKVPSFSKAFSKESLANVTFPHLHSLDIMVRGRGANELNLTHLAMSVPNLTTLSLSGSWFFSFDYKDPFNVELEGVPRTGIEPVDAVVQVVTRLEDLEELEFDVPIWMRGDYPPFSMVEQFLTVLGSLPFGLSLRKLTVRAHFHWDQSLRQMVEALFANRKAMMTTVFPDKPMNLEVVEISGGWPVTMRYSANGKWEFLDDEDLSVSTEDAEESDNCWCSGRVEHESEEEEEAEEGEEEEWQTESEDSWETEAEDEDMGDDDGDSDYDEDEEDYDEDDDDDGYDDGYFSSALSHDAQTASALFQLIRGGAEAGAAQPTGGPSSGSPAVINVVLTPGVLMALGNLIRLETGRQPSLREIADELRKLPLARST